MERVFDFIAGAGIIQGVFVATLLFAGKRSSGPGNRILAFLMLALALSTAHPFFGPAIGPRRASSYMIDPMQLLLNPFIWLFVSVRAGLKRFRPRDLLHFGPFALVSAVLMVSPAVPFVADSMISIAYWALALVQALAYFVPSARVIHAYSKRLEQSYSRIDAFRLEGLHAFMLVFLALMAGRLAVIAILAHSSSISHADRIMELLQAFAAYFLGVFALFRTEPEAGDGPALAAAPSATARDGLPRPEPKYEKNPLNAEEVSEAYGRADALLREKKLYLDPELSLPALAEALGMGRNDLSRAINEGGGSSFYDFVNRHRIREFQGLAGDPAKASWKILAIAMEAGFNSKPAFNSAFKRLTGVTPSAWLKAARGG
jgi:AraC-like DNA-binding protein